MTTQSIYSTHEVVQHNGKISDLLISSWAGCIRSSVHLAVALLCMQLFGKPASVTHVVPEACGATQHFTCWLNAHGAAPLAPSFHM